MHKSKLMQNLRFSDKENINFLIFGIGSANQRNGIFNSSREFELIP